MRICITNIFVHYIYIIYLNIYTRLPVLWYFSFNFLAVIRSRPTSPLAFSISVTTSVPPNAFSLQYFMHFLFSTLQLGLFLPEYCTSLSHTFSSLNRCSVYFFYIFFISSSSVTLLLSLFLNQFTFITSFLPGSAPKFLHPSADPRLSANFSFFTLFALALILLLLYCTFLYATLLMILCSYHRYFCVLPCYLMHFSYYAVYF
jgi:hypothetical protein